MLPKPYIYCLLLGALFGLVTLANPAHAGERLRCDQSLIARGATFVEVLERCGEPAFEFGRAQFRFPGFLVQLDEWTYELGRNKFRRVLHFEDGRLRRIERRAKPIRPIRN